MIGKKIRGLFTKRPDDEEIGRKIEKAFGALNMKSVNVSSAGEVSSVYAWLVEHPDGTETIPCIIKPANGLPTAVPLVSAQVAQALTTLREWAKEVRSETGYPVRLVRFERQEVKEELS